MYSKIASFGLLLAGTGVGATYTLIAVPTGTGVVGPPYSTGTPSTQPLPEEPLQVTVDNCITFRNAGISLTCADTPDSLRPGNATTNGYVTRRKRTNYSDNYGPGQSPPPVGGKRPLCYKFILGYHDANGPVAPQQFPCYADESQTPIPPESELPAPPAGTGTPPTPIPEVPPPPAGTGTAPTPIVEVPPENPEAPPEAPEVPPPPAGTGTVPTPPVDGEVPPEAPEVPPEAPEVPPEQNPAGAPEPTEGYATATPPQPSAQPEGYNPNLR
ncbi:uncharacterized protein EI97DRAFT_178985 [Westerdykella ornata]|uniref:Uncharacterized protein n=1 Tax=Westerdykella ornata TaxID=318751 RepID=A0A6A6JSJ9_WESOR|nr:uncharacterized protein EI97DRAFT_178985 [Westerdykella ornata]KAF2279532.1 hypothetical protein EI97DRAFT_178985 [Westerdykella ornata]